MSNCKSTKTPNERESDLLEIYRQMNDLGQELMLVMAHAIAGNPNFQKSAKQK